MPAKSRAQQKLIFAKRNEYKTKSQTPEKWKWVWEKGWEKLEEEIKGPSRIEPSTHPFAPTKYPHKQPLKTPIVVVPDLEEPKKPKDDEYVKSLKENYEYEYVLISESQTGQKQFKKFIVRKTENEDILEEATECKVGDLIVLKNPTDEDLKANIETYLHERTARGFVSNKNDTYMWDAMEAAHFTIVNSLRDSEKFTKYFPFVLTEGDLYYTEKEVEDSTTLKDLSGIVWRCLVNDDQHSPKKKKTESKTYRKIKEEYVYIYEMPYIQYGTKDFDFQFEQFETNEDIINYLEYILKGNKVKDKYGDTIQLITSEDKRQFVEVLKKSSMFKQIVRNKFSKHEQELLDIIIYENLNGDNKGE